LETTTDQDFSRRLFFSSYYASHYAIIVIRSFAKPIFLRNLLLFVQLADRVTTSTHLQPGRTTII
jgi:hypothetical protein